MTTAFSSLPIVSLKPLSSSSSIPEDPNLADLSKQLYSVFATTGFAYLTDLPLSFSHDDVFGLAKKFFALPEEEKMKIAKRSFRKGNVNTYRGYFPTQPIGTSDNLKEGFEMGPPTPVTTASETSATSKFNLSEPNVWPDDEKLFSARPEMERLYAELQDLSSRLLSLLAVSLGKDEGFFSPYLEDSLSTLRLLHYPNRKSEDVNGDGVDGVNGHADEVKLSCTEHTDSGILTLLHQDPTGGLEVRDSTGKWVPAPYVPGTMVVNIGDLMAEVSGGRFVATMHRVRAPVAAAGGVGDGFGRFSVPFFFEPGEKCVVRSVDVDEKDGEGVVYGDHVREKMKTWVEFRDEDDG